MSTLEKFGILVILILVVIIGVVAVWGVGGEEKNPFAQDPAAGENVAAADPTAPPAVVEPGATAPVWTGGVPPTAAPTGPVPPPSLGATPNVPSPAPVAAAPAGATTYTVQKGDTGATIAKKTLGDANRWKEIAALNNNKDPRKLKINEVLKIPAAGGTNVANTGTKLPAVDKSIASGLPVAPVNTDDGPTEIKKTPEAAGREVEVRSGDTLYEIARRELGDPNLYYKIIKANPGLDPKKIRPGMKIKLPAL